MDNNNYKLYSFILKPISAFSTKLRGDTLFGSFCWQCVYNKDILKVSFDDFIKDYNGQNPSIIFSSAFYYKDDKYIFKKPSLLSNIDVEKIPKSDDVKYRKAEKEKRYFSVAKEDIEKNFTISSIENYEEHKNILKKENAMHNKINRETFTTTSEEFAPYGAEKTYISPEYKLAIFILFDENKTSLDGITKALTNIGKFGFGKDASIGMGKFNIENHFECQLPSLEKDNYYTLSPFVYGENDCFEEIYYQPITKFGKHGDASVFKGNPFKNPILMIDESAVFKVKNDKRLSKPFIGSALQGVSKQYDGNVLQQAFSIVVPWEGELSL
ncbi:MAG: type III-A CRISPR-associated RAMP protein Csm4 [Bdellovibrionota bacterium]